MKFSLLSTKLYIPPPLSDLVFRPRLIEQLSAGLKGKLTLLSAPAGYGKTTLLSTWLNQFDRPAAWLSLDEGDNDIARFLDYLIAALQTLVPECGAALPTLHGVSGSPPTNILLTSLINEISNIPQDILLILDDYHTISVQEIHQVITFLLENLPKNLHITIASRTDPPLQLARLRARGHMVEIRARDLRFTQVEAADFLNRSKGLELNLTDIQTLVQKTEGWIAGLQLAAISLQGYPDRQAFVRTFAGDDRHIADYLFEEVLNSLPPHIQKFLLETSILDRLSAPLCQAITGRDDSQEILATLERANLFLVSQDNRRHWYRYHHLFADLLRLRLKREHPSSIPTLNIKASEWYENQGFLNQAVIHAIGAGDITRVEKFVQANTLGMLEIGESATVNRWLKSLPEDVILNSLWLTVARGWTLMLTGDIAAADMALQNLETLCANPQIDIKQMKRAQGQIAALRAYIADLMGDPLTSEALAREALEKLSPDDQLAIAIASMMLATAYNRQGDTARAEVALQDALATCETNPYSFAAIDALCMMSGIQYLNGQLYESAKTLKRAFAISDENTARGNRQFPIIGLAHIYYGRLLLEWNQVDQALKETTTGIKLLEPCGYTDCVIVGSMSLSDIYHTLGDDRQALDAIEKARRIARDIPYWAGRAAAQECWLHALRGDSSLVMGWLAEQETLLSQEPEIHHGFIYRYLAKTLIARENYAAAAELLHKVIPVTDKNGACDRLIRTLVLQAVSLTGLDDLDGALAYITRALELAEPGGYMRVFLNEGEPVAQLLYQAAQKGIHAQYCLRLLDEFSKQPLPTESTPKGAGSLIEPLSQREIEVLQLVAGGCSNQEIAGQLVLSLSTVKSHIHHIFGKLGVKNRTEAVAKARLLGILSLE